MRESDTTYIELYDLYERSGKAASGPKSRFHPRPVALSPFRPFAVSPTRPFAVSRFRAEWAN